MLARISLEQISNLRKIKSAANDARMPGGDCDRKTALRRSDVDHRCKFVPGKPLRNLVCDEAASPRHALRERFELRGIAIELLVEIRLVMGLWPPRPEGTRQIGPLRIEAQVCVRQQPSDVCGLSLVK